MKRQKNNGPQRFAVLGKMVHNVPENITVPISFAGYYQILLEVGIT
ncbi:hypothetical protein G7055_06675 [Streptococcus pyogenes]|nr:hypothetical protein G7055_06675 [Streptococcus pyogenes]